MPPTGATIELRGITVWRIGNGRMSEEWTSFNELPAYIQVATQLRWPIIGFLFVVLAAVIVCERLLVRIVQIAVGRARGRGH